MLEKKFGSDDESMERVYDSEEEYYYLRPKPKIRVYVKLRVNPKLRVNLKITPKILLNLKLILQLILKLKPKTASTLQLSMNVKNVKQNLKIELL